MYTNEQATEQCAHDTILAACRGNRFHSRGTWGMRTDVALDGFGGSKHAACAVIDLERALPHPYVYGMCIPRVLASGATWAECLTMLRANSEL